MNIDEMFKLFGTSNQLAEHDLDRVEKEIGFTLGRGHTSVLAADDAYYPQIESEIRRQAADGAALRSILFIREHHPPPDYRYSNSGRQELVGQS